MSTDDSPSGAGEPVVLVERRGRILIVTINRPRQRNALDGAAGHALAAAMDELDADDGLSVGILTGAGGTFSAGMDLKAFLRGERPDLPGRGLGGITQTPPRKPLIAAVEGWALAGGFELLLACDLVVAASTAKFGVPEVKRGLVAGGGAVLKLPRRVPYVVALELLLTGEPVSARRAYELGLINRVVADSEALAGAIELAEVLVSNGPLALAATKEVASRTIDWQTEDGWQRQEEILAPIYVSDDAREGASAFAEKRPPVWTGK
ncbi:crotonase/enoyl-CoA hydratase family protein [Nocardia alni]|uniref:crotonase/enoyl-CoA hydratase family protein n=1 Tax=Nocardia alni TaxID=2815723 RepID=UPI001C245D5B|nr:crotonase/enoyl-CoA hydratase family protein [Nocardia alni]